VLAKLGTQRHPVIDGSPPAAAFVGSMKIEIGTPSFEFREAPNRGQHTLRSTAWIECHPNGRATMIEAPSTYINKFRSRDADQSPVASDIAEPSRRQFFFRRFRELHPAIGDDE